MTGIETLRLFAEKTATKGCQNLLEQVTGNKCSDFGYCAACQRSFMVAVADQIEWETLPRPLFEDGEPVDIGSYIGEVNGTDYGLTGEPVKRFEISAVHDSPGGEWVIRLRPGQVVKRPERDTWERIAADVDSGKSYAGMDAAEVAADVLRRCKALAGVE